MAKANQKRVRNLSPGQYFLLCRTGQLFKFLSRNYETPSGTKYLVYNYETQKMSTLHHSCYVTILEAR